MFTRINPVNVYIYINKRHPEHLGPDGTISIQAPGVISRAPATRRGERTAVSQDLVRDCDPAMRSLDAPATQPVGDTATCSLQIRTVRGGAKTGHRLRTEISDRFAALWQRNQLDDGPSSPGPTGSRYGER